MGSVFRTLVARGVYSPDLQPVELQSLKYLQKNDSR